MKIYSNGKDRTLTGSFPARFKLLNNGVEVPFIRTGKGSVRLSGEIPFGELDVEEVIKQKVQKKEPKKLDAMYLSIINRKDVEKIEQTGKSLQETQNRLASDLEELDKQNKAIYDFESHNEEKIERVVSSMTEMAGVFGKEIQADRERIKATAKSIAQDIAVSSEVLNAKIEAHEKAKNPHKITKETIGLDKVENTSDLDKPVSNATQKALDKKADKSDIEDVRKAIKDTEKKQERLVKSFDNANLYGGVGGNELPSGGKAGQILSKGSDKTGDYKWVNPESGIEIVRVDELPDVGETGVLYLVPSDDPDTGNVYEEYIWTITTGTTYGFELIGSTEIDLTGYATEQWVQNQEYAQVKFVDWS